MNKSTFWSILAAALCITLILIILYYNQNNIGTTQLGMLSILVIGFAEMIYIGLEETK